VSTLVKSSTSNRVEESSDDLFEDNESSDEPPLCLSDEDDAPEIRTGDPIKLKNNEPRVRPGITIPSLNMRGRQKDNRDKMKMVIGWLHMNRIAILALQETHLMKEAADSLDRRYRNLKFFGSGLPTSSGGILFIVSDNTGSPQNIHFEELIRGRVGLLSLEYGAQVLNIVDVYMLNHKSEQCEALKDLRGKLKRRSNALGTELLVMGDWNKVDRSPQHGNDGRVMDEIAKLRTSYDLMHLHGGCRSAVATWSGRCVG
jgi:hypothetical protein